ncbi:MAG: nitrite reductase, copper-containing [Chloroflexi bacterium]|nr:MAG: nitrite reductase, copper-containing [Chloroflexota bacterium]
MFSRSLWMRTDRRLLKVRQRRRRGALVMEVRDMTTTIPRPNRQDNSITTSRFDRRLLLKRMGAVGLALPLGGMLLNACGGDGSDNAAARSAPQSNPSATAPLEVTVVAVDLKFEPATITVDAGQLVRLTFDNQGVMEHDWYAPTLTASTFTVTSQPTLTARATDLLTQAQTAKTPYAAANAGESMVIEFTPDGGGDFEFYCAVPGHKEAGMVGTLTVRGTAAAAQPTATHDGHQMPTTTASTGVPYAAERLPSPSVAPPVGNRGPQELKVEIEIVEKVAYVDDGVAFEYWTFGGTVPGPMVRARVGDTVELTLKNPASSKMSHNIDLHAVTGPGGGGAVTLVAPGESKTFRWKAMNPGVYVYHCATAPIPQHISAGMYGLAVIEPEGGLPPVDREFYVMQGDLYLAGARGEKGLRGFDFDKLYDERPDYVIFNGAVGSLAEERALQAKVGETVRIFFGVGGPNVVSSFHVIGEIFDRVMLEGASEWSTNVQTTLVPAGGATIVEFSIDVPGTYMLVDHSLGRLAKGAIGMLVADGPENPDVFMVVQ